MDEDIPFQHPFQEAQVELFDWHPNYEMCQRFFLDHGQHTREVQAVADSVNVKLPLFQNPPQAHSRVTTLAQQTAGSEPGLRPAPLLPFVRRLVVTGFGIPAVLHAFFGESWESGVGTIWSNERRNYLFAVKSENWLQVMRFYDMGDGQECPDLVPLYYVSEDDIQGAESDWSEWLATQDWMLGPRAPGAASGNGNPIVFGRRRGRGNS